MFAIYTDTGIVDNGKLAIVEPNWGYSLKVDYHRSLKNDFDLNFSYMESFSKGHNTARGGTGFLLIPAAHPDITDLTAAFANARTRFLFNEWQIDSGYDLFLKDRLIKSHLALLFKFTSINYKMTTNILGSDFVNGWLVEKTKYFGVGPGLEFNNMISLGKMPYLKLGGSFTLLLGTHKYHYNLRDDAAFTPEVKLNTNHLFGLVPNANFQFAFGLSNKINQGKNGFFNIEFGFEINNYWGALYNISFADNLNDGAISSTYERYTMWGPYLSLRYLF